MSAHAWLKAARMPSQSYIAVALLLGQCLALSVGAGLDIPALVAVHAFGLCIQLYIVFANDCADRETDRRNRTFTPFSGGSRVLVDGDLTPAQLRRGAWTAAAASLACAVALGLRAHTVLPVLLACAGLALVVLYSFPPFRLSYRGGGELLQMLGVGVVLPLMGFAAQAGTLAGFSWPLLSVILPTQLACAIGTALPDEPSDRMDRKRTLAVLAGRRTSRAVLLLLHAATVGQLLGTATASSRPWTVPAWTALACGGLALMLPFVRSEPGTRSMTALVFFSVLTTLASMAALIARHCA